MRSGRLAAALCVVGCSDPRLPDARWVTTVDHPRALGQLADNAVVENFEELICLDGTTGERRWSHPLPPASYPPAFGHDQGGRLLIVSAQHSAEVSALQITAIDAAGGVEPVLAPPVPPEYVSDVNEGMLALATHPEAGPPEIAVYQIGSTVPLWSTTSNFVLPSHIAISPTGKLFTVKDNTEATLWSSSGQVLWRQLRNDIVFAIFSPNDSLFLVTISGSQTSLARYDDAGTTVWRRDLSYVSRPVADESILSIVSGDDHDAGDNANDGHVATFDVNRGTPGTTFSFYNTPLFLSAGARLFVGFVGNEIAAVDR